MRHEPDQPFQAADFLQCSQLAISKSLAVVSEKDSATISIALSKQLGVKDRYTEGHVKRVSVYSQRLAKRQNLSEDEVEQVRLGGLLHDIGKIGFSDVTFRNKNAVLTHQMTTEISAHPLIGRAILAGLNFTAPVLAYVCAHHERLDGTGYPLGLNEGDIPIGAQIISVADHFDAMTTNRPYRQGMAPQEAFSVLRACNEALSQKLVESLIEDIEENGALL